MLKDVFSLRWQGVGQPPWRRQGLEGTDNVTVQTEHSVTPSALRIVALALTSNTTNSEEVKGCARHY